MGLNKLLLKWTYILVLSDENKLVNLLFWFILTALISVSFRCNRQLLSVKELQKSIHSLPHNMESTNGRPPTSPQEHNDAERLIRGQADN